MGVGDAGHIQHELLSGLPATTPVAVVQSASLPDERQCVTTLGELHAAIQRERIVSPAVIVVGNVVSGVAAAAATVARVRSA
jgi:uroporphyrin-III C-methyltransferase